MDTNNANMETGMQVNSLPCSPDVGPVCSPKEICVSATLLLALVQMLLSTDDL